MDFQIVALSRQAFGSQLEHGPHVEDADAAKWIRVDHQPGFPCRVSLEDAEVGEQVLALSFTYHDVDSPYRASGPIFIREAGQQAAPAPGEVPRMLRSRLLSLRGYNSDGMLLAAAVEQGSAVENAIAELFADREVAYLQLHNAATGCFFCSVNRASS